MFKESTPESRNAKRDAIAAKYPRKAQVELSPALVAGGAVSVALVLVGWIESWPL